MGGKRSAQSSVISVRAQLREWSTRTRRADDEHCLLLVWIALEARLLLWFWHFEGYTMRYSSSKVWKELIEHLRRLENTAWTIAGGKNGSFNLNRPVGITGSCLVY